MSAAKTPATARDKAEQILDGLAHQDDAQRLATCCALLAMLTSATKDEREAAKRRLRELAVLGRLRQQATRDVAALASFANRHEP